ncbi:MAG: hypothetical protein V1793_18695 [Pseudomonadota bacterium]
MAVVLGFVTIVGTSGDKGASTTTTKPESGTIYMPQDGAVFVQGDTVSFISSLADLDSTKTYTYSWVSTLDGAIGTAATVSSAALSAGTHVIVFTVTDATGNTVVTDSVSITVGESSSANANTSPVAAITAPAGDMSFNVGETVTFQGSGTDAEDGTLSGSALVWGSNINGALGTGSPLSVSTLSQGEHTITLTVTDNKGASSNAFVIITVGSQASSPTVAITSPVTGAEVKAGDTLSLIGNAMDFDGAILSGSSLEWISSKDGVLGTGATLTLNTRYVPAIDGPLKEGVHTIYLRASGKSGTGQASVSITLTNTNPVAVIANPPETCPTANSLCKTFAPGEWINFQGTGVDTEDGDLSGENLEWKSHIDGYLGSGEILDIKTSSVPALGGRAMTDGEHIITLEAKDGWGASGTDSVIITIGSNTPPVPTITYPATDYTSATSTGYITFYGKADDAEDGTVNSDRLEWYRSDQMGKITPEEPAGAGLVTSSIRLDLSTFTTAGATYTITLVATDSMGEKGVTARNLTMP